MKRVLLADSTAFVRTRLKSSLENKNHSLIEASTVTETLTECQRAQPEVMVIDINLEDTNKIGFIQELKKIDPDALLIIIAKSIDKEMVKQLMELGIKDIFVKPFRLDTLINRINK
ncbi:MAG: response regulator [Candidatus Margulisbacteria bacterium]|nr:response regulator [Candidatus Margulisiibacteriota bacterium]